jgi:hypothetical protein
MIQFYHLSSTFCFSLLEQNAESILVGSICAADIVASITCNPNITIVAVGPHVQQTKQNKRKQDKIR